jgi:hypothetical protein
MIHTDAAALAFTTLACGVFCNPRKPIAAPQVWLAGVGCVLAVGSKQTMAPIALAIALYLAVTAGAKLLGHFVAALLISGAVLVGTILAIVPARAFLFNTITLAAHRPLKDGYLDLLVSSYRAGKLDSLPALFPILLLIGWQIFGAEPRPGLREFRPDQPLAGLCACRRDAPSRNGEGHRHRRRRRQPFGDGAVSPVCRGGPGNRAVRSRAR